MNRHSIWILDDEIDLARTYAHMLQTTCDATAFESANEVLRQVSAGKLPDLFITDIMMPEMNGLEFITELRKRKVNRPIIIISGNAEKEHALQALQLGVSALLEKPFHSAQFFHVVNRALAFSGLLLMTEDVLQKFQETLSTMNTLVEKARERYVAAENKLPVASLMDPKDKEKALKFMKDVVLESKLEETVRKSEASIKEALETRTKLLALSLDSGQG